MHRCFSAFALLALAACGGSDPASPDASSHDASAAFDAVPTIDADLGPSVSLAFERIGSAAPHPFRVTATVSDGGPVVGAQLEVATSAGTLGDVVDNEDGTYSFVVTPSQSGEHQVTVGYEDIEVVRTAVVTATVHPDWGQAMAVEGLVNTEGYEDGVTITPNGEYLFVQYGPVYFSGIFLFQAPRASGGCQGNRLEFPLGVPNQCEHPWIDDVLGPYEAPERPGFFSGRISSDGQHWLHNAASWDVGENQAPNFAVSTMFYGFRRQADGSFAEPFYIAFQDENDGLMGPFGLSFIHREGDTAQVAFAFNDPQDVDQVDFDGNGSPDAESFIDVFTTEMTLGEDTILGTYVPSGVSGTPPVRAKPFQSELVNFGKTGIEGIAGTQGNPSLYAPTGEVEAIFTDDEFDEGGDHGEVAVHVLESGSFPKGTWSKRVLPSAINKPESDEIQPYFTGTGLYFTRLGDGVIPAIRYSDYSGSDTADGYANPANWTEAVDIMTAAEFAENGIAAVGEPTITTRDGVETLYFVYAVVRGFDAVSGLPDLNLQAGFIEKNAAE